MPGDYENPDFEAIGTHIAEEITKLEEAILNPIAEKAEGVVTGVFARAQGSGLGWLYCTWCSWCFTPDP